MNKTNTTQLLTRLAVQLLTRRDVKARWRCSIEYLKRRERAGILTPVKIGKIVRYDLSEIERIEREARVSR